MSGKALLAERFLSGFFSADGKRIIVLGDNTVPVEGQSRMVRKAHLLDAENGRDLLPVEATLAAPLGEKVLLSDGETKLSVLAPAESKVVGQLDCGKSAPVVWMSASKGIVLGTETDGSVRLLKGLTGKLDEQTVWRDQVDSRIVKALSVHGDQVAVAYWGGTLRVLDEAGKPRLERSFAQDIAALAWSGDRVIVALVDGEVIALEH
jgi:hypothetical protein